MTVYHILQYFRARAQAKKLQEYRSAASHRAATSQYVF